MYDGIYLSDRSPERILEHRDCGNIGATIRGNRFNNHLLLNKKYDSIVIAGIDSKGACYGTMKIDFASIFGDKIIEHACVGDNKMAVVLKRGLLLLVSYDLDTGEHSVEGRYQMELGENEMPNAIAVDDRCRYLVLHTREDSQARRVVAFEITAGNGLEAVQELALDDGIFALYSLCYFCFKAGCLFFCGISYKDSLFLTFVLDAVTKNFFELKNKRVDLGPSCARPLKMGVYKNKVYCTDKLNNILKFKFDFTNVSNVK